MSHRSIRRAAAAAAALGALLASGCKGHDHEEQTAKPLVTVRTTAVAAHPFQETIGALGVVVTRPGRFAALSAPGPTRVTKVLVAPGQRVKAGQPLVELDRTTFASAVQEAEAGLDAARRAHDRAQRLADLGVGPRKDVEQTESELARANTAAVNARRASALAAIQAPLDGVITRLDAVLGASVDANQVLVEIADPSAVDLVLNVSPTEAARVRVGASVVIAAGQSGSREPLGTGQVADVSGIVDSATRSVSVRARLPAPVRPLRIGETVFGSIVVATRPSALAVPLDALVPDGDGFKVFVVDPSSIAHARPVEVGARTDSTAEISKGLTAGERVVTHGAYGVTDSARVVLEGAKPKAADEK